jgi:hypothetical protein
MIFNDLDTFIERVSYGLCPPGTTLDLGMQPLDEPAAKKLADILMSGLCPSEMEINLEYCQLSPKSAQYLATALRSGGCPIHLRLKLANNPTMGFEGIEAFADALKSAHCSPKLLLDFNVVPHPLHGLLHGVGFVPFGTRAIALLIRTLQCGYCSPELTIIATFGACIPLLAETLASGLCPTEGLTLKLADNYIEPQSYAALLMALTSDKCPTNLTLSLRHFTLTSSNLLALTRVLTSGLCASNLNLEIKISDVRNQASRETEAENIRALTESLLHGPHPYPHGLRLKLYCDERPFKPEVVQALNKALQSNRYLKGSFFDEKEKCIVIGKPSPSLRELNEQQITNYLLQRAEGVPVPDLHFQGKKVSLGFRVIDETGSVSYSLHANREEILPAEAVSDKVGYTLRYVAHKEELRLLHLIAPVVFNEAYWESNTPESIIEMRDIFSAAADEKILAGKVVEKLQAVARQQLASSQSSPTFFTAISAEDAFCTLILNQDREGLAALVAQLPPKALPLPEAPTPSSAQLALAN